MDNILINGLVTLTAVIIGGVLTILANHFQQTRANKAEKNKIVREKIEQIYTLSNYMESYSLRRSFDLAAMSSKQYETKYIFEGEGGLVWEEDKTVQQMMMITKLYTPEILKDVEKYKEDINKANRRIDNELNPKGRSIVVLADDKNYIKTAEDVNGTVKKVHEELRIALAKAISKY